MSTPGEPNSDTEFRLARDYVIPTLSNFPIFVQDAFLTGWPGEDEENLIIDHDKPAQEIEENALLFIGDIVGDEGAKPRPMHRAYDSAMDILKTDKTFKAFMLADDIKVFKEAFPKLLKYSKKFKLGLRKICLAITKAYPVLITSGNLDAEEINNIGLILEAMMTKVNDEAERLLKDARVEHRIVKLLIKQWKGTTLAGLQLIVKAAKDFQREFQSLQNHYFDLSMDLLDVMEFYPTAGTQIITKWHHTNYGKLPEIDRKEMQERRMELVKRFGDELIPLLSSLREPRVNPKLEVTDLQKLKYLEKIKGKDGEDDFWGFHYPESPIMSAVHANSSQRKWPTTREQYAVRAAKSMAKFFRAHPEFCQNCLEKHQLEHCTNINSNPKENLAAYTNVRFGEITKTEQPEWLSRCAKSLSQPSD